MTESVKPTRPEHFRRVQALGLAGGDGLRDVGQQAVVDPRLPWGSSVEAASVGPPWATPVFVEFAGRVLTRISRSRRCPQLGSVRPSQWYPDSLDQPARQRPPDHSRTRPSRNVYVGCYGRASSAAPTQTAPETSPNRAVSGSPANSPIPTTEICLIETRYHLRQEIERNNTWP